MGLPSAFLLEYDALCDERYVELFRGAGQNIELGLWYEIVEPLTTDIGIPYNSTRVRPHLTQQKRARVTPSL